MQMEYLNVKSPLKKETEDAYVINERRKIYGVFDGATPLTPFNDEDGHNGAYLAANLFREYFEQLDGTKEITILQAVIQANDLLRQKMEKYQIDQDQKHHLWSTCVALVEIKAASVEYVQLGDSIIIAGYKDGSIHVLTKDTVKDVSIRAREKRRHDRQAGLDVPVEETFRNRPNVLIYNRSMANTPEGYGVANGMAEVKNYVQSGTIDLSNLSSLLLITDGLFFPDKKLEFILESVKQKGLSKYIEEQTHYLTEKGMAIDDRTAILLTF
jgi:serine/threonine protein phosphatase PrpC